ncbi:MAG: dihydrodipicolinate reductase [Rhodobacteraceae bacterium]|nr:dihydrodipicolinate reductase [Paracoccaceae bacterium]
MLRIALIVALFAIPAWAEFEKVEDKQTFTQFVTGKTLTRPMVKLRVAPEGLIVGRGLLWDVTGAWTWQNGYFCRELYWGSSELGYNCQEVRISGDSIIRFTSDRGAGHFADFRLH